MFAEAAATAAQLDPTSPSLLQAFPLAARRVPRARADHEPRRLGFAFDASTSPKSFALIQMQLGHLGPDGDWQDGEVTPIRARRRAVRPGARQRDRVVLPQAPDARRRRRRRADAQRTAKLLGLRPYHRAAIDVPLYAFQTSLTHGGVLRGARRLIASSLIPRRASVLVDGSATQSHLDPLAAAPTRNRFLTTVVPFLKRLTR